MGMISGSDFRDEQIDTEHRRAAKTLVEAGLTVTDESLTNNITAGEHGWVNIKSDSVSLCFSGVDPELLQAISRWLNSWSRSSVVFYANELIQERIDE